MNRKIYALGLFVIMANAIGVGALEISGVEIAPTAKVEGQELKLNGAGLRTVTILQVKAYVAAFYTPRSMRTPEDVLSSTGPMKFDFTFVRAFNKKDVTKAWTLQFRDSATFSYPDLEKDVAQLTLYFDALRKYGVETIELVGDNTRITDDGVFRGEIAGRNFQKAFLSLWFGSNPVPRMKEALLGQEGSDQ